MEQENGSIEVQEDGSIIVRGVIIEKGFAGNGTAIYKDCELKHDADKMFLILGFNPTNPDAIIGEISSIDDSEKPVIKSDLKIYGHQKALIESKTYKKLTPAIGGRIVKSHMDGDVRVIDNFHLTSISLCDGPNADPSIKTIGEQMEKNEKADNSN